jgi:hypothetical protein
MGLAGIAGLCAAPNPLVFDVKACYAPEAAARLGITYARL